MEISIQLSLAYTLLFQTSVTRGEIPVDWRHGFVTPLFKKGDQSKAKNYPPISRTSVTSKLLEHIIYGAVMDHLERLSILSDTQHGFRKCRSTETQLILTIQDLAKGLDDGGQIDALLLNFSKAFDTVPHKYLQHKLDYYRIRGSTLNWIKSFLRYRTQQVLCEGKKSQCSSVENDTVFATAVMPRLPR